MAHRVIKIESCSVCPHKSHGGGFGPVKYIPKCALKSGKVIPHEEVASRGSIIAFAKDIPSWCPLALVMD